MSIYAWSEFGCRWCRLADRADRGRGVGAPGVDAQPVHRDLRPSVLGLVCARLAILAADLG